MIQSGHILPPRGLEHRIDHGAAAVLHLQNAVKDVLLPHFQGLFHIALIEEGEEEGGGAVHGSCLHQLQPLPDAGQAGALRDHPLNAHLLPRRSGGDGVYLPPVLVAAGIEGQQVAGGAQAQLFQLGGPGGAHPGQGGEREDRG